MDHVNVDLMAKGDLSIPNIQCDLSGWLGGGYLFNADKKEREPIPPNLQLLRSVIRQLFLCQLQYQTIKEWIANFAVINK